MRKGLRMLGVVVILGLLAMTSIGSRGCFGSSSSHHTVGSSAPPAPWTVQLGTIAGDVARGVATDDGGNIYVAGYTSGALTGTSFGGYDLFLIKYDAAGVEQWIQQLGCLSGPFDEDEAFGVAVDTSGAVTNVYVAGHTKGDLGDVNPNQGGSDLFVVKYNSDGVKQWARQLGTNNRDMARDVATDLSGNVYVVGFTAATFTGFTNLGQDEFSMDDLFVVKYNTDGVWQWTQQLGTDDNDNAYGVATDDSGNVYVVGETYDALTGTSYGSIDLFVVKYDKDGNWQWTEQLGSVPGDAAECVTVDTSGAITNIYVAGYTNDALTGTNFGGLDFFVVKYNTDGEKQWTRQLGTTANDSAYGVATDTSGDIYVTGLTSEALDGQTYAGLWDLFVVKYNTDGEKQWTRQLGTAENDRAYGVATDTSGNIYAAGYTYGGLDGNTIANPGSPDLFIVKYNSAGVKQ